MAKVNISSGGVRANVRAGEDIAASRLWKYSSTENEVTLCGAGEEADGLCLAETLEDEILNLDGGSNYARCCTGVFDEVANDGTLTTIGAEWMSAASGVLTAYVATSDNRPLGKVLRVYDDVVVDEVTIHTAKISFYSK